MKLIVSRRETQKFHAFETFWKLLSNKKCDYSIQLFSPQKSELSSAIDATNYSIKDKKQPFYT